MPSRNAVLTAAALPQDDWVNVRWQPHTTLSQTSHVCLLVRSAHFVALDALDILEPRDQDWQARVSIRAVGGLPLTPLCSATPAAPTSKGKHCCWDAFIKLPVRWRDLPQDAYLQFQIVLGDTLVSCCKVMRAHCFTADVCVEVCFSDRLNFVTTVLEQIYNATLPFFSKYGMLRTGLQRVDLINPLAPTKRNNPGIYTRNETDRQTSDGVWDATRIIDKIERLQEESQTVKTMTAFGRIPSVPWLDAVTKERAQEEINEAAELDDPLLLLDDETASEFLIVELPVIEIPILHEETFYPTPQQGASGPVSPLEYAEFRKHYKEASDESKFNPLQLVSFLDYENELDNPVEDKYRTLAHDLLRGLVDPALKPDRKQRDRLAAIIDSTSHHPTREEKDLLWRFRFSLVDNRRALTKFLLAVDWTVDGEVVQAAELLEQWRRRSPIEVSDALKLLGKHVAFQTNLVRSYAIDTLAAAPDSELRLYLLQLVQALKYENIQAADTVGTPPRSLTQVSSLAAFLIDRAAGNIELANYLYWYAVGSEELSCAYSAISHGAIFY
jgi:hypothetical protein